MPVKFESDSISLQLPSEEDNLDDGWNIVPLFSPVVRTYYNLCIFGQNLIAMLAFVQISKEQVDSCTAGQEFPHCELTAEWTKQNQPPSCLKRKVVLSGAKEPYNYFVIMLDTKPPGSTVRQP